MRYTRNSYVTYRSGFNLAVLTVVASGWVLGIAGAVSNGDGLPIDFLVSGLAVLPFGTIMVLRVRVVLRGDDVVVYDIFKSESVRYDAIAGVRQTGSRLSGWMLEIRHSDGRTITQLPILLSGQAPITRWHRRLADEVTQRVGEARSGASRGSPPLSGP